MLLEKYNTVFICSCEINRKSADCKDHTKYNLRLQKFPSFANWTGKIDFCAKKIHFNQQPNSTNQPREIAYSNQKRRKENFWLQKILQRTKSGVGTTAAGPSSGSNWRFVQLTNLLMEVSKFENIGYVQGMNYIAAVLIFHGNDYYTVEVIK